MASTAPLSPAYIDPLILIASESKPFHDSTRDSKKSIAVRTISVLNAIEALWALTGKAFHRWNPEIEQRELVSEASERPSKLMIDDALPGVSSSDLINKIRAYEKINMLSEVEISFFSIESMSCEKLN
jgi:hypothetical protein